MINPEETKRKKAEQFRYKKPIVKDLNLMTIKDRLWEIQDKCEDINQYVDIDEEILINAFDGNRDEAYEFRTMFADLCVECDRMQMDLEDEWVPGCFDLFFVAAGVGEDFGGLLGYDSYEQDYFGLSCADVYAEDEAKKALKRLTKDDLIAAARQCMRIYQSYIALSYRYDCLKAAMDILRDQNTEYLQIVNQIEEVYEKANRESYGFKFEYTEAAMRLDEILKKLPDEAWLQ